MKGSLKILLCHDIIEFTDFTYLVNQFLKFCIRDENVDKTLQRSPIPKTIRVDNVDDNVRYSKIVNLIMIVH